MQKKKKSIALCGHKGDPKVTRRIHELQSNAKKMSHDIQNDLLEIAILGEYKDLLKKEPIGVNEAGDCVTTGLHSATVSVTNSSHVTECLKNLEITQSQSIKNVSAHLRKEKSQAIYQLPRYDTAHST